MNAGEFEQMMLGFSLAGLTDTIGAYVEFFKSKGDEMLDFGDVAMTGNAAALFAAGMFAMGTVVSGCIEHGDVPNLGETDEDAVRWVMDVMGTVTVNMLGD